VGGAGNDDELPRDWHERTCGARRRDGEGLLYDDLSARIVAQRAAQRVVENGTAGVVLGFDRGRCRDDVAGVRQRDGAAP